MLVATLTLSLTCQRMFLKMKVELRAQRRILFPVLRITLGICLKETKNKVKGIQIFFQYAKCVLLPSTNSSLHGPSGRLHLHLHYYSFTVLKLIKGRLASCVIDLTTFTVQFLYRKTVSPVYCMWATWLMSDLNCVGEVLSLMLTR